MRLPEKHDDCEQHTGCANDDPATLAGIGRKFPAFARIRTRGGRSFSEVDSHARQKHHEWSFRRFPKHRVSGYA